jgi:hypothetical protein
MLIFSLLGFILIAVVLWDAFETIVLPRRVNRRFRVARMFYRLTWYLWSRKTKNIKSEHYRETYLGFYGPLSLIMLLVLWASTLITGFALLHWGLGTHINAPEKHLTFLTYLYASGTMFFTLGLGDIAPKEIFGRLLFVIESGTGFAFLAVIIGYLPVLYQAFSQREIHVTLLDARAGSPPTALNLLQHYAGDDMAASLQKLLEDWELWCGDILETHLSYPVLAFYRSQHDHQSWVTALTTILDVSALIVVGLEGVPKKQAKFTFAMARHTAVDLAQVFYTNPDRHLHERLSHEDFLRLKEILQKAGVAFASEADIETKLKEIRKTYEPYMQTLAEYLLMPIPPFIMTSAMKEDWQSSPWDKVLDK